MADTAVDPGTAWDRRWGAGTDVGHLKGGPQRGRGIGDAKGARGARGATGASSTMPRSPSAPWWDPPPALCGNLKHWQSYPLECGPIPLGGGGAVGLWWGFPKVIPPKGVGRG